MSGTGDRDAGDREPRRGGAGEWRSPERRGRERWAWLRGDPGDGPAFLSPGLFDLLDQSAVAGVRVELGRTVMEFGSREDALAAFREACGRFLTGDPPGTRAETPPARDRDAIPVWLPREQWWLVAFALGHTAGCCHKDGDAATADRFHRVAAVICEAMTAPKSTRLATRPDGGGGVGPGGAADG